MYELSYLHVVVSVESLAADMADELHRADEYLRRSRDPVPPAAAADDALLPTHTHVIGRSLTGHHHHLTAISLSTCSFHLALVTVTFPCLLVLFLLEILILVHGRRRRRFRTVAAGASYRRRQADAQVNTPAASSSLIGLWPRSRVVALPSSLPRSGKHIMASRSSWTTTSAAAAASWSIDGAETVVEDVDEDDGDGGGVEEEDRGLSHS